MGFLPFSAWGCLSCLPACRLFRPCLRFLGLPVLGVLPGFLAALLFALLAGLWLPWGSLRPLLLLGLLGCGLPGCLRFAGGVWFGRLAGCRGFPSRCCLRPLRLLSGLVRLLLSWGRRLRCVPALGVVCGRFSSGVSLPCAGAGVGCCLWCAGGSGWGGCRWPSRCLVVCFWSACSGFVFVLLPAWRVRSACAGGGVWFPAFSPLAGFSGSAVVVLAPAGAADAAPAGKTAHAVCFIRGRRFPHSLFLIKVRPFCTHNRRVL